jgi:hypothetical protein
MILLDGIVQVLLATDHTHGSTTTRPCFDLPLSDLISNQGGQDSQLVCLICNLG